MAGPSRFPLNEHPEGFLMQPASITFGTFLILGRPIHNDRPEMVNFRDFFIQEPDHSPWNIFIYQIPGIFDRLPTSVRPIFP